MQEVWKDIVDYEGLYQVSNLGRVQSYEKKVPFMGSYTTKRQRQISVSLKGKSVYPSCVLCKLSVKKTFLVHRLVAMHFVPNPENKRTVNHIDNNPLNNRADNLEWKSQRENIYHAVDQMRHCHGETHGCHKLTEDDIKLIRSIKSGVVALAKDLGVHYSTLKKIRRGELWKHVA